MQEALIKQTPLSDYSVKAIIVLAALTLSLLFYGYYSWRLVVIEQTPLLDTVMQVKVDLADSHSRLMELVEGHHVEIDKQSITALLFKAERLVLSASTGNTMVGDVEGRQLDDIRLNGKLDILYNSVNSLRIHLQPWLNSKSMDASELGEMHDQLYNTAMNHAELCDERIHEVIHETLDRQQNIFVLLLFVWGISLALLWWKWVAVNRLHEIATDKLRKLSQAVDQAGEFIMITDNQGSVEYVNPAFSRISGYSGSEMIGNHVSLLGSGEENGSLFNELRSSIFSGEEWRGEFTAKRKNGVCYPALMSISPIRNSEDQVSHFVVIQQDISEHEALQEQLRQSMKMESIGTLVGGIAHDFNNVLAGFMGNLFLLRRRINDNPYVVDKLNVMERMSLSAAKMISQLLTFARKDVVRMTPLEFAPFFQSAIELARAVVPANVEFNSRCCQEEIHVLGSDNQLQQVLINLVANAHHAVKRADHPVIDISADSFLADEKFLEKHSEITATSFVRISVSDNGYGIPEDQVERVFEPFFTTKEVGQGTGLGLSMVYGAVQGHGGVIDVESKVGKGTTFHIYLPQQKKMIIERNSTMGEVVRGRGETILMVDDDSMVVETNRDLLRAFGYKVLVAHDGLEAITVFDANRDEIALIIMDCVMPRMGGARAAKQICQHAPGTKILFMTGYNNENTLDEALSSLGKQVLFKPCEPDKLSRVIRKELDSND